MRLKVFHYKFEALFIIGVCCFFLNSSFKSAAVLNCFHFAANINAGKNRYAPI